MWRISEGGDGSPLQSPGAGAFPGFARRLGRERGQRVPWVCSSARSPCHAAPSTRRLPLRVPAPLRSSRCGAWAAPSASPSALFASSPAVGAVTRARTWGGGRTEAATRHQATNLTTHNTTSHAWGTRRTNWLCPGFNGTLPRRGRIVSCLRRQGCHQWGFTRHVTPDTASPSFDMQPDTAYQSPTAMGV